MKIIPKRYKEVSRSRKEGPRASAQVDVIIRPDLGQQLHPFSGRLKTCRDVIKPLVNDRRRSSGPTEENTKGALTAILAGWLLDLCSLES